MHITSDFLRGEIQKEQVEYDPKRLFCECRNTTIEHFISLIEKMESKDLPLMDKPAHHIPNIKQIWKKLFFSFASKCILIKTSINVQNDTFIFKRIKRAFTRNPATRFLILVNEDRLDVDTNGFSWKTHEIYLFSRNFFQNEILKENWDELSEHGKWFYFEEYFQLNSTGCLSKAAYLFPFDNCFQFENFHPIQNRSKKLIIEPMIYIDPNMYLHSHFYTQNLPKITCDVLFLKMESKFLCDLIALNGLVRNDSIIQTNVEEMLASFLPAFFERRIVDNSIVEDLSKSWFSSIETENKRRSDQAIRKHRKNHGFEMENEIFKGLDGNVLIWERKSTSGEIHTIEKFKSVPGNENNNNSKSTIYSIKSSKSEVEQKVELFKNGEFSNRLIHRKDCKVKTPKGKYSLYGYKSGYIPFDSNQQDFKFCLIVLGIEKDAQVKTPKLPESKLRASSVTPLAIFPFEVSTCTRKVSKYSNKKIDDYEKDGKMETDHLIPKDSSYFYKFVQFFNNNKKESKEEEEFTIVTQNQIVYGNEVKEAKSIIDNDFTYWVNKKIIIHDFDPNDFNDCGKGIHFFLTQMEAIEFITGIKCVAEDSIINYDKVEKICSFE
jgi:hypothetical protein